MDDVLKKIKDAEKKAEEQILKAKKDSDKIIAESYKTARSFVDKTRETNEEAS